jgi:hypothetical protein
MLRSTLSYLSFGLVSETVESESVVAEVPKVENVEITSPVEDNWVILGQDLTEERPVDDSVSVPVQNIDDRPSRRNKKLAKRKAKDVLKVSTTNYSRDIRNEMGIRTIPTRKTTKLNKQMNKKVNQPISHKFQHCNK